MRIGLVSPYSFDVPGGVQNHVLGLADWLRRRGHEVTVAGPGNATNVISLGRGVPVAFNGSVARVALAPPALRRLRRALSGMDVVHVHEPLVPLAGVAALYADAPVVATYHAATGHRLHGLLRPLARRRLPDAAIAVSSVAAAAPRAFGLDPVIIGNGIDAGSFRPHALSARPTIVFLGRLDEPRKGFDVLARALPGVLRSVPRVEAFAIGRGRSRADGVLMLGQLSDAERNRVLATSDVLVAPHLRGESFGMVLVEAMASGCQVVASDLPAFREVTSPDAAATHLVPPGDPNRLATALVAALSTRDEVDRDAIVRHARAWDWGTIGPRIESVYDEIRAIT